MKNGTSNNKWIVIAATVASFNMFLPAWHEARRNSPESDTAYDCRYGYGLALGWSFLTGLVVAGDDDPRIVMLLWIATALAIICLYEKLIRQKVGSE